MNRMGRVGLSLLAASSLLWLGAELTRRFEWIFSYMASVGALFLLIGISSEVRRYKNVGLAAFRKEHRCRGTVQERL
jgi:hypothetical protein